MRTEVLLAAMISLGLAGCNGAPPSAAAPPADDLAVTLGRGEQLAYGVTKYPLTVDNKSGRALDYVQVDCTFYDAAGGLIDSSMKNWGGAQPGERLRGVIYGHVAHAKRHECSARSHL